MAKLGDAPEHVRSLYQAIADLLDTQDGKGRKAGDAKYGVYLFRDYDREPIYVGQTTERLRTRIRRHMTNQRTDAVAMNVLDRYEVAYVTIWPLWELEGLPYDHPRVAATLNAAEFTVYQLAIAESRYHAILNEANVPESGTTELPAPVEGQIVTGEHFQRQRHPDVRIARRAQTIAGLAKVISERDVSKGLRRTLVTQARRLESLARERLEQIGGEYPVEAPGEETGDELKPGGTVDDDSSSIRG